MNSGLILAAGMSRRMGRPKATLDWGGELLVCYQVRQLREAGLDEVIVVLGDQADSIHRRMKGADCRVMFNPMHQMGRAGTLRIGARAVSRDAEAILITNVDEPRPAEFYRDLLQAHAPEAAATIPTHEAHRGHPVIVAGRLRIELLAASEEEQGLRGILARHAAEVREHPSNDLCQLDLNTPEDYTAARERFGLPV